MDHDEILDIFLQDILENDDSDSDDGGQVQIITVNIWEWKRLGDPTFETHFRMDRCTFESLLVAVGLHLESHGRLVRQTRKGLDYSLLMVLWILASPDTFRSVGVQFGVSKQTVHFHYKYIIQALREMAPFYVKWPNRFEKQVISATFEARYGYPSVCGCIDGCLICITAPLEQPQQYVDRHHSYSIILQGVCDHRLLFRDVYIGEPGSVGDKRTFRRSPLGQNILRNASVVGDMFLLGDGGYSLTSKLIIPYRNLGNLTRRQRIHNYILSRCRSTIERAFALLKGKWRRLKYFPNYCLEYALDHIMACVVLHNFVILEGVSYEDYEDEAEELLEIDERQLLRQARADGIERRDFIAGLLDPQ